MNDTKGRIGPGASTILMILTALLMTMLGVLALMSARSDMAMSERTLKASEDYYNAQTEFGLWIKELDAQLFALREQSGGNAEIYEESVREMSNASIGEELEFVAAAGDGRVLRAFVKILPLADSGRFSISHSRLEPAGSAGLEEENGWNLLS